MYVKYSIDRKDLFQIKTLIKQENGEKRVIKQPCTDSSLKHIENIYRNYCLLGDFKQELVKPNLANNEISFPFVEGESFSIKLMNAIKQKDIDGFFEYLNLYVSFITCDNVCEFYLSDKFINLFSEYTCLEGLSAFQISNIDLNFDNLIINNDNNIRIIDYEWVFNFPIPHEFIIYRAVKLFLNKSHKEILPIISEKEIFDKLGIEEKRLNIYEQMEINFMEYVTGGKENHHIWSVQKKGYLKPNFKMDEMKIGNRFIKGKNGNYLQIYFSNGNPFEEEKSIKIDLNENLNEIYKVQIPKKGLLNLRIDPTNYVAYCYMEIKVITHNKEYLISNRINRSENITFLDKGENYIKFISDSNDPQLIFENLDFEADDIILEIKMNVSSDLQIIQPEYKQIIKKYVDNENEELLKIENEIKVKNLQLEVYQERIKRMETDLRFISHELDDVTKSCLTKEEELLQVNIKSEQMKGNLEAIQNELVNINEIYQQTISTKGWRYLEKFRKLKSLIKRNKMSIIPKTINKVKNEGLKSTLHTIETKLQNELKDVTYHEWFMANQLTAEDILEIKDNIKNLSKKPIISVIMPTYNTPINLLDEAINSLKNQIYSNWELCICDDQSPNNDVWERLQYHANLDKRIKIIRSDENLHIAGATNLAITLATGEYVGFLDHDDILTNDALSEVVKRINETNADLIYSDEDKLEMDGTYSDPFFKPDWSPDYLLSVNYICHFAVYKKSIGDELGWIRLGVDGSQDHDLLLRFTEKTEKIEHIPKILYHWRKIPSSTAQGGGAKNYAWDNGVKAIQDALNRRGIKGQASKGESFGHYEVRREILENKLVSIIIPIRDKVELLRTCISSIEQKTTYKNYEIIIIDNGSTEEETLHYLKNCGHTILRLDIPFNYSKLNNEAVKIANGEYVLFLNNDMEIIEPEWLTMMVEHVQRPEVGAVGAKLYYSDNRIQHAGIIIGIGGVAGHSHKYFPRESQGYFSSLIDTRNYSGVTGACLLTRKEVFNEVNGFNEENLAVAFNDVDLCLKIREKNYLIVLPPKVELYHHESVSRGHSLNAKEIEYMKETWPNVIARDPYYNENLTLVHEDYSLKY